MSKALTWIRKSKGSDDDIGLKDQRDKVKTLAGKLADTRDDLDLGVHTGFSSMTRDDDSGLIDQNERVTDTVERLRGGEYDYLVAWDDRRVCRDEFFSVIEYAANQGGCEIVYFADVDDDDLTFDLKRRIERDTKEDEIRKAKRAIKVKKERGDDLGRPRFGYEYNSSKTEQVPDNDDFERALRVIELRDEGATYSTINNETGVSEGTIANILDRREQYLAEANTASQ
ncbi:resolvase [Halobacteriaceae bacterium SHR40]|uniref:resolvase n=1 Tax=Halovenus amylolytica TaxID=2500550 RepID=UPI000FE39A17